MNTKVYKLYFLSLFLFATTFNLFAQTQPSTTKPPPANTNQNTPKTNTPSTQPSTTPTTTPTLIVEKAPPMQECYEEKITPARYKIVVTPVLVKEAASYIKVIPPTFETIQHPELVRDGSNFGPVDYDAVEAKAVIQEGYTLLEVIPPAYKNVQEQVLVKEASEGQPEEYAVVTKQVLQDSARIVERKIPPAHKSFTKLVVLNEYGNSRVAPEYRTITKRVVKTPSKSKTISLPAEYQTVDKYLVDRPSKVEKIRVPCDKKGAIRVPLSEMMKNKKGK